MPFTISAVFIGFSPTRHAVKRDFHASCVKFLHGLLVCRLAFTRNYFGTLRAQRTSPELAAASWSAAALRRFGGKTFNKLPLTITVPSNPAAIPAACANK